MWWVLNLLVTNRLLMRISKRSADQYPSIVGMTALSPQACIGLLLSLSKQFDVVHLTSAVHFPEQRTVQQYREPQLMILLVGTRADTGPQLLTEEFSSKSILFSCFPSALWRTSPPEGIRTEVSVFSAAEVFGMAAPNVVWGKPTSKNHC